MAAELAVPWLRMQEFATDTVPLVVLERDRVLAQDVYDVKSIM